jgi:glycerophosphoryl diester phosphodiesterase
MTFEIQAHQANDAAKLERLLAAGPTTVELDVGLRADGVLAIGHETDLSDASALTLDDALARAGETPIVADVKCYPPATPGPDEFVAALEPYLSRLRIVSFERGIVERLRGRAPVTFLFGEPVRLEPIAETVGPRHTLVTAELVREAHELGIRVVPWTVNDPDEMRALVELGVDGLVTDEPALAREVCGPLT